MNKKIFILYIFISIIFVSCFKDEGNYEYTETKAPVFNIAKSYAMGYDEGNLIAHADYYYPQADSLELEKNTKCEWVLNGVVLGTGKDLSIPVSEAIEKLELEDFGTYYGTFRVTNTQTGISYLHKITYYIRPKFWKGSWLILSEEGANSKLSYQRLYYERGADGEIIWIYQNYDNIFSEQNEGKVIPGEPLQIIDYRASHINSMVGATTILTKQVAWDINNENFTLAADLSQEFTSGKPDYDYIKDIRYDNKYSFMLDNKGNLYTRKMSDNNLGGKYLTEPNCFDEKGAKIDFIGESKMGAYLYYLFDGKNNRLNVIDRMRSINPLEKSEGDHIVDVTNFGDDKEIIYVAGSQTTPLGAVNWNKDLAVVIYKKAGKLYAYELVVNAYYGALATTDKSREYELPFTIGEDDLLWIPHYHNTSMPSKYQKAICYTKGNEFRLYDREKEEDKLIFKCDHKITALKFYGYYSKPKFYNWIAVGLENGDFFMMDTEPEQPVMVEETKFNVGGPIKSLSLIGSANAN